MSQLYPLRFEPIFRRYVWGGRRLGTVLGKDIGDGQTCAEAWEVVDHGADQVRCSAGPLSGKTLHEIVAAHGSELFGPRHNFTSFPLLLKFLDAAANLSVQVHPNDAQAALAQPPDLGKTEAWVVLHAEPGSKIYAGLKSGTTREQFEHDLRAGRCLDALHSFEPQVGDCVFIPAGTVHALGAGLMICEIQQASDTTYRLFDWNRTGADGQARPLHIEQALAVIDFASGPVEPIRPTAASAQTLVACEQFTLTTRRLAAGSLTLPSQERFHLLAVLDGSVQLAGDVSGRRLERGGVALVPACWPQIELSSSAGATLLDIYLP